MPKDKLTDYSATNASNTDVGGVNTDEGMLPSAVNNAIREVMTHLKNFASGTDGIDVLSLADDDASAAMKIQAPASVTADTTLTLPDGDGDDGQALVTDGSGTLSWASLHSAKNLIINGAMQVSQRGDVTGVTSAYGGADRFRFARSGAAAVTLSQDTDVPSNQGFSYSQKIDITTADNSLAAGDYGLIIHRIEAQNLQHLLYGTSEAKKLTLQFWVKSPKTGKHVFELTHADANYYNNQSYTITTADTWQKVTMTFDGYQTTAINNDNGLGLVLQWWLAAGDTYAGGTLSENTWHNTIANRAPGQVNVLDSTSNNFYLTGVQLTVGDVALPFIHESYAETLRKCQRYFCKSYDDDVVAGTSTQTGAIYNRFPSTVSNRAVSVQFPVTMRDNPTATLYSLDGTSGNVSDCNTGYSHSSNDTAGVNGTVGRNGFSKVSSVSNADVMAFHYTAEAEL